MRYLQPWQPEARPEWVTQVNRVGKGLVALGEAAVSFDIDSLRREASLNRGGLKDFGDDDYLEPLMKLVAAIEHEAQLHLAGSLVTRDEIVNALECRLWLADLYRRHPEIEQVEIVRPVFVGGMGRSGTSIVHETLAAAPDARPLCTWEIRAPWIHELPAAAREQAKDEAWQAVRHSWYGLAPELEAKHQIGRDMPQECAWVLNQCFATDYYGSAFLLVPGYQGWMAAADKTATYRHYKRFLKAIHWLSGKPDQHYVLKTPTHNLNIETIYRVFPDARFVWTHRDPIKTLASGLSMRANLVWSRSDQIVDTIATGRETLGLLPSLLEWAVHLDRTMDKGRLSPLVYNQFQAAPVDTLAQLHANFGLRTDSATLAAMQDFLAARQPHAKGEHHYDCGMIGITDIRAARQPFEAYQRYFGVSSEW